MPDDRFAVRSWRDGDETAILELFARSFPHAPRSSAHFRWKYLNNPFGNGRISLTFDSDGRLVGHYAGYPVPWFAFGKELIAHQIGDTMTDVSIRHAGRGPTSVLGRTALDFYARFCGDQVAFNYGFNVANIQKFSLRFLRSSRVEPVTFRLLDVRRNPLSSISLLERWGSGYQLEPVSESGGEWDELFKRVARHYGFCVRRDAAYVRWRYLSCPDTRYFVMAARKFRRLVGWIVYRVEEGRLLWGDALFDPEFPDAAAMLLRHVFARHPVDVIEAWYPPRPVWFDRILSELGFERRPEPQDLSFMCVPFTWPEVVGAMRESLHYSWGDSDLF
jgi:hypothetical protein